jgi:hypothetical protein
MIHRTFHAGKTRREEEKEEEIPYGDIDVFDMNPVNFFFSVSAIGIEIQEQA